MNQDTKFSNSELSVPTDVAVAIIMRPNREFLLTQRPQGKPYEGYWEFPGGKLERGEQPLEALCRELQEELGIHVNLAYPWVTRIYEYPHAKVRLHFYRVLSWDGEPHANENQQMVWQSSHGRLVDPILPANGPILKALRLPMIYAISNADAIGVKSFMKQLDVALRKGLRFLQLREKNISAKELRGLARNAVALAHEFGAVVTVNSHIELAIESGADGVHFTSRQLYENKTRPDVALLGASCHNAEELELAVKIGADFVVLGPLNTTPSHAALSSLGWENFSELIGNFPLPALAIGGLQATDLTEAWKHGAHGIAMLRAAWPEIKPVTLMPAEVSV